LTGHTQAVFDVAFSPDARLLATSSWDGTLRFYVLPVDELMALAETRVTRSLTPEECQRFLHQDECP
jgi:WD40 repeat protein